MKKAFFYFLLLFSVLAIPLFVHAAATITFSPKIPGMTASPTAGTSPSSFVAGFYKFALMIGGALAFGAVVYGGILYAASAGNPGKQSEGREWIKSALFGLLLLAGAYLILYTVNPDIISLSLPKLPTANVTASSGGNSYNGPPITINPSNIAYSQSYAASRLQSAGVSVVSTGNCSDKSNSNCTSLDGMQKDTVDEIVIIKDECNCTVTVTGGTEAGHSVAQNGIDHGDGYKVDLAANAGLTNYIENASNGQFTQISNRGSDGAVQYRDNSTGAVYAYEASKGHWDVTVP